MSSTAISSGDRPPCKKMTNQYPEMSILSLPHDFILNIIARVSKMYYPTLSLVSKKFRSVVASPELYKTRSLLHCTESCLYLCLRYHLDHPLDPNPYWFTLCKKPNRTLTDGSSGRLFIPISSPDVRHEPSTSVVAVGSNIYKIGGHMPSSSEVSVLDCRFNTWHNAPRMRVNRSSPATSVVDGKIYVAGGCEDLSSENWVEVFDPKTQTWGSVTNPGIERFQNPTTAVESFVIEGKLYLFGDKHVVYVYDPKEARWNTIALGMDMVDISCAVYYNHCVIGDVLFLWNEGVFSWYDLKAGSWKKLNGVEDLPDFDGDCRMVDLAGKKSLFGVLRLHLRGAMEMRCGGISSRLMPSSQPTSHVACSMLIFFLLLFD